MPKRGDFKFGGETIAARTVALLLFLLLAPIAQAEEPNSGKYKVCTITINSADERDVMRARLDPKDFEFVELTEISKHPRDFIEPENWFDEACASGVQCDVLLISGHFAETFHNEKDPISMHLSLKTLEKHSCHKSCEGILKRPREIFLLGCNTLAEKDPDSRTPEKYLQDMLRHGLPRDQAELATEARYGLLSTSNRQRMRSVFENVPRLYGFYSQSPLGPQMRGYMERYLSEKKDYAQHLERYAVEQMSRDLMGMNQNGGVPENTTLASIMKVLPFAQCSGLRGDEPGNETRRLTCELLNNTTPIARRLELVEQILKRADFLQQYDVVGQFLRRFPPAYYEGEEAEIFARIRGNRVARAKFREAVANLMPSNLKLDVLEFLQSVGWMTGPEQDAQYKDMALKLLKGKMEPNELVLLNQVAGLVGHLDIRPSELPKGWKKRPEVVTTIGKLHLPDPEYRKICVELLKDPNPAVRVAAVQTLKEFRPDDKDFYRQLMVQFAGYSAPVQQVLATELLVNQYEWIEEMAESRDPSIQRGAKAALRLMQ